MAEKQHNFTFFDEYTKMLVYNKLYGLVLSQVVIYWLRVSVFELLYLKYE